MLLVHEADDAVVSAEHDARFRAAKPTTQTVALEAGDPARRRTSSTARSPTPAARAYEASIGAFADRAVAAHGAERDGARTGCSGTARSLDEVGLPGLAAACAASRARTPPPAARLAQLAAHDVKLRGEVNAARIWSSLRSTLSGRRALAAAAKRRAKVTVRAGDRSRVVLSAAR